MSSLTSVTSVVLGLPQYSPGKGYGHRGSAEMTVVRTAGVRDVDKSAGCVGFGVCGEDSGVCEGNLIVLTKVDVIFEVIVRSLRELVVDFGWLAVTVMKIVEVFGSGPKYTGWSIPGKLSVGILGFATF